MMLPPCRRRRCCRETRAAVLPAPLLCHSLGFPRLLGLGIHDTFRKFSLGFASPGSSGLAFRNCAVFACVFCCSHQIGSTSHVRLVETVGRMPCERTGKQRQRGMFGESMEVHSSLFLLVLLGTSPDTRCRHLSFLPFSPFFPPH